MAHEGGLECARTVAVDRGAERRAKRVRAVMGGLSRGHQDLTKHSPKAACTTARPITFDVDKLRRREVRTCLQAESLCCCRGCANSRTGSTEVDSGITRNALSVILMGKGKYRAALRGKS